MSEIDELKKEVNALKSRNKRVEADKAWEQSWFRVGILTTGIYILAGLFLLIIETKNPWLGALVPAIGYFISVQSLPPLKKWWLNTNK